MMSLIIPYSIFVFYCLFRRNKWLLMLTHRKTWIIVSHHGFCQCPCPFRLAVCFHCVRDCLLPPTAADTGRRHRWRRLRATVYRRHQREAATGAAVTDGESIMPSVLEGREDAAPSNYAVSPFRDWSVRAGCGVFTDILKPVLDAL